MANLTCTNFVRFRNILLLVSVILVSQYAVLTHSHDSLKNNADAICKVCISGEHLSHLLLCSGSPEISLPENFFLAGSIEHSHPVLIFIHAFARAPPAGF